MLKVKILEVSEMEIKYWTQKVFFHLGLFLEPTAALGLAGLGKLSQKEVCQGNALVILSGKNQSCQTISEVWSKWLL